MNMINALLTLLLTEQQFFFTLIAEHIAISGVSIFIATVLGLTIGIFITHQTKIAPFVLSFTNIVYTIPAISLLGLFIPISGIGNLTAITALTIYALLPMIRNTYTGILGVDPDVLEAAKGMGTTNFQMMYKIKLPLAVPVILAGFRNMVVMTIALAGIASFIGAGGLGVAIYRGITTNNMTMTIAGSLLIAIIAFISDALIGFFEKTFAVGQPHGHKSKLAMMTLLALIIALILFLIPSKQTATIKIAAKPMTEQLILTEMLSLLIRDRTGLNVEITKGVGGGTSNIQPALLKGDFDLYPEYTGTAWLFVLKKEEKLDDAALEKELERAYSEQYQLSWVGFYGFNNTYGLAVRRDIAQKYNLKTYSDLAKLSTQLVFGGEYDFFQREDGYAALVEKYGFNFKKQVDIDIGLKYNAINNKQIDAMNIFTTDGQLSVSDIEVLKDDRNLYDNYYCGTVVRQDTLRKYPQLKDVLLLMNNIINEKEMARLNYMVEGEHKNEREVARFFLIQKGLLKAS